MVLGYRPGMNELSRPLRKLLAITAMAVSSVLATGSTAAVLELHRGVAVHDWLNWSPLESDGSYRWPPYRSVTEWLSGARDISDWPVGDVFEGIRALGFDFV